MMRKKSSSAHLWMGPGLSQRSLWDPEARVSVVELRAKNKLRWHPKQQEHICCSVMCIGFCNIKCEQDQCTEPSRTFRNLRLQPAPGPAPEPSGTLQSLPSRNLPLHWNLPEPCRTNLTELSSACHGGGMHGHLTIILLFSIH